MNATPEHLTLESEPEPRGVTATGLGSSALLGSVFVGSIGKAKWLWRVDTEPALADDGTGKTYVLATPVKPISRGMWPAKNKRQAVWFLPLPQKSTK